MYLNKPILLSPGPTPVPDLINHYLTLPMIGHRTKAFQKVLHDVSYGLAPIFGTDQPVVILAGSGTSALEAAMINVVEQDDHIVVIVIGAFGNRFKKIAEAYHYHVHVFEVEWGKAVNMDEFKSFYSTLKVPIKAVFTQLCETSTAVIHPIHSIGHYIKSINTKSLFIVDGVSIVGAYDMDMKRDNIDILVAGSQKALMLPPGMGFVAYTKESKKAISESLSSKFYLNLAVYIDQLEKDTTPYTPPIGLIQSIRGLLEIIETESFDNTVKRHYACRDGLRAALRALEIPLFVEDADASPTVTAIVPHSDEIEIIKSRLLNEFNITIAGGQAHLKGKILRIGHMGYVTPFEMLNIISALEIILSDIRGKTYLGKGLTAFQEVIACIK